MVKNKVLVGVLGLFILVSMIGAVSAAAVITSLRLGEADNFYSNYAGNNVVNLIVNATGVTSAGGYVRATFSSTINCGTNENISLTNDTYGGVSFNGTCDVGAEAATSNFAASPIIVTTAAGPGPPEVINTSILVVLYNMSSPLMPPGCQRFGPLTTNFTSVLDFQRVSFVVHIQNNFTCMVAMLGLPAPPSLSTDYLNVMIMNLTSVNLSTPAQAQLLAQLPTYLSLNISQPKAFPSYTRIYVNGTGFASLNTNATIQILNLPFTSKPDVSSDNMSELVATSWANNGFDAGFRVVTGNLTINVTGFTEYVPADVAKPLINFVTPASASNVSSGTVVLNVLINGTGSELSYVTVTNISGGTQYIYNDTSGGVNSAQCQNISVDSEIRNCTIAFPVSGLAEGANIITVNAWDYGGTSGNTNSSSRTFNVDRTGPAVTVITPASYFNTTSAVFNISALDATTASFACWMTLDNGVNNATMTKSGNYFNATNASIGVGNYLAKFYCNDTLGNLNGSVMLNFTVDRTAPALTSQSMSTGSTSATLTYAASESVNISVIYGTSNTSLSSSAGSASYSSGTTLSLSSLSASTTYYYNTTICDQAGNCLSNGTFSFTTSAASSNTSSSSSGGGDGSLTNTFWTATYNVDDATFQKGYTRLFAARDRIKVFVSSDAHYVGLIRINGSQVVVNVSSIPQQATLSPGESKKFEVSGDDVYDVLVTFTNLVYSGTRANITVMAINEKMPTTAATPTSTAAANTTTGAGNAATSAGVTTTTSEPAAEKSGAGKTVFWIIMIVLILAALASAYYYFVIKKKIIQRSVKVRDY